MTNFIQPFSLDDHQEIDSYLSSWLLRKENMNINSLLVEAHRMRFSTDDLRKYFIEKGKELLNS
jgi:hypothetical protein